MDVNKQRAARGLPLYRSPHDVFGSVVGGASSSPSLLTASSATPALMMVNTAFGFEYPQPISPFIRMTGPILPPTTAIVAPPPASPPQPTPNSSDTGPHATAGNAPPANPPPLQPATQPNDTKNATLTPPPSTTTAVSTPDTATAAASISASAASPPPPVPAPPVPLTPSDIPPNLREWLDSGGKPVILVLTGQPGSMTHFERWQIKNLAQGLIGAGDISGSGGSSGSSDTGANGNGNGNGATSSQRFRVLWSMREEQRSYLGPILHSVPVSFKIKTQPLQQVALLAHPAVRVVVSPCGLSTAQEALYYGKPLLCIPVLGDQIDVAARVVDSGCGLSLDKTHLEVSDITRALNALMGSTGSGSGSASGSGGGGGGGGSSNPNQLPTSALLASQRHGGFRAAAKRVSHILRTAGGVMTAADTVEFVLRQYSTPHGVAASGSSGSGGAMSGLQHLVPFNSHVCSCDLLPITA